MSTAKRSNDALRAGLFVAVGLVIFTVAIFLLGQKSALFSRTTTLYVRFADISGLTVGAPVRLAGLEVGSVAGLTFPEELDRKETRVKLVVLSKYMGRIRADSRAFIESAGLLGDKIINVSLGTAAAPELRDGDELPAGKRVDFDSIAESVDQAVGTVARIGTSLERIVADGRTEQVQGDVARITGSLANILGEVEHGPGLAHKLLYDPAFASDAEHILGDVRAMATRASHAVGRADRVLAELEGGDGTLHALVYGQEGKEALAHLADASKEVDSLLSEVRDGKGLLHELVYSEGGGSLMKDLGELGRVLRKAGEDIDKGRGTLGGLVKDPTVYEDLKTTLGNVKRNVMFKALIRWTVDKEDLRKVE
jgi:phospholipid/cholesterol/gamma-HCH transport system substrate-binding protein